jgi:Glutathione-dependent formaldehyde-activating enzyme
VLDRVSLAEAQEPEGLNRAVCKTVVRLTGDRRFESLYPSKRLLASRHRRLAGRSGLPGVARESCVLSTWRGPAPRQVGRDGSPVGGCASSASTGIDARCGGPDVSEANRVATMGRRTGSTYGIAAFFPRENVIVADDATAYTRQSDSGYPVTFYFCPHCGVDRVLKGRP